MVRVDSEKNIDIHPASPLGGGRPGRIKRKTLKGGKKKVKIINFLLINRKWNKKTER